MPKLVSIITPCFNSGKHIHRLLDSVLAQDYPNIEHIIIDDGSTDNTAAIIRQHKTKYDQQGKQLHYYYQKNAGQAAAINKGLKLFKGEYLTWPDSDDYWSAPDALSTMVNEFESLPNHYGMVRSDGMYVDEKDSSPLKRFSHKNNNPYAEELFDDCLQKRNFWFCPGSCIVSKSVIDDVIENRSIFAGRGGQNYQMFLPVLYKYKCRFIDKPLFNVLIRRTSHSRSHSSYAAGIHQTMLVETIIINTINRIEMSDAEKEKCFRIIKKKQLENRLNISYKYRMQQEFNAFYNDFTKQFPRETTKKQMIKKLLINTPAILKTIN